MNTSDRLSEKKNNFLLTILIFKTFMKKILLLAVAALLASGANAQLKRSATKHAFLPKAETTVRHQSVMKEMHKADADHPILNKAPKKASYVEGYYKRPAGAFIGTQVLQDGVPSGAYYSPFMMLRPFAPHQFVPVVDGMDESMDYVWGYEHWNYYPEQDDWLQDTTFVFGQEILEVQYDNEFDDVPRMFVAQGDDEVFSYQMGGYKMGGTDDNPIAEEFFPGTIMAYPTFNDGWSNEPGYDLLVSSKTFVSGGRNGDQRYQMTYYSGAEPWGDNESGWWFGKNGGRANGNAIDGIAQAFEKPAYPYVLKQVAVETAVLVVDAPVEMTCKVYRLDQIPPYDAERPVALPDEPGELIATGRATVTPETNEAMNGIILFTLFGEEDGLEYEITPTIDDAILVVIDGYNDEGMENLHDFSAMISTDEMSDEGYGELAYVKYGTPNDEGGYDYVWAGLNNFFTSGTMMTGMSIFITIDTPFLTYNWSNEDGEYTFPKEGGLMEKNLGMGPDGKEVITRSIEFYSAVPSVDEGWTLTCDGDDVPEWLSIELTDGENEKGEFNGQVNAEVVAEPLPEGVAYREAIVRFEFPGAYLDYKFMQGKKPDFNIYDVNRDGEVNIADVNALLDMILGESTEAAGDVNSDGEVNIADVNAVSDYVLTH